MAQVPYFFQENSYTLFISDLFLSFKNSFTERRGRVASIREFRVSDIDLKSALAIHTFSNDRDIVIEPEDLVTEIIKFCQCTISRVSSHFDN
jgi:hypothetical protein